MADQPTSTQRRSIFKQSVIGLTAAGRINNAMNFNIDQSQYMSKKQLEQCMDTGDKCSTWSRYLVQNYLSKYKWYNPHVDNKSPNAPDILKGWSYFEHVTLARHAVKDGHHIKHRALPGLTEETELFSLFGTRGSDLNAWGLGVGLYFTNLKLIGSILLIAGCISIPNIIFYKSNDYQSQVDTDYKSEDFFNLGSLFLQGSAICFERAWQETMVPCSEKDFSNYHNCANTTGTKEMFFLQRNACKGGGFTEGMFCFGSMCFITISLLLLGKYQKLKEKLFDEENITPTDYSVMVRNPPVDAYNPEEWRNFFSQFTVSSHQATACTVVLKNKELIDNLIKRRILRRNLRNLLPEGLDIDDKTALKDAIEDLINEQRTKDEKRSSFVRMLQPVFLRFKRLCGSSTGKEVLENIQLVEDKLKGLMDQSYDVSAVIVTFETEADQRNVFKCLDCGLLDIILNKPKNPSNLFQGRVLKLAQPVEPSAVYWGNVGGNKFVAVLGYIVTVLACAIAIATMAYLLSTTKEENPSSSALLVLFLNLIVPMICTIITRTFESHESYGNEQTSIYIKITLFKWVNTAILFWIFTDFTKTLSPDKDDLLNKVAAIFVIELLVSPLLRVVDIVGQIKKHILAPRAKTQLSLNLYFQGAAVQLSERYTDQTKMLFLCLVYAPIFPSAYFIGGVSMFIQYYVDKYCLLRVWANAPHIGTQLEKSRRKVMYIVLVIHALFTAFLWGSFPFDDVCEVGDAGGSGVGTYTVRNETDMFRIEIDNPKLVKQCSESFNFREFSFRGIGSKGRKESWMLGKNQEGITYLLEWTSLVILITWVIGVSWKKFHKHFLSFFRGVYHETAKDQEVDFSNIKNQLGYIPQKKNSAFPFPLITCDVDEISHLVGWNDPDNLGYDHYNLIYDLPYKGQKRNAQKEMKVLNPFSLSSTGTDSGESVVQFKMSEMPTISEQNSDDVKKLFSVVKHWPPKYEKKTKV